MRPAIRPSLDLTAWAIGITAALSFGGSAFTMVWCLKLNGML